MKRSAILFFIIGLVVFVKAQTPLVVSRSYTDKDMQLVETYFQSMQSKKTLPFNELIIETAQFFLNTPYVASTLEGEQEHLIVNLREMDCTTFVENVLALAYTVRQDHCSFEMFCTHLKTLRYRTGNEFEYTDRLHYFSDWIFENEQKGLVKDVTKLIGGEPYSLNLSFMSTHPDSYSALKAHPEYIDVIKAKEQDISARSGYAMIPKTNISNCAKGMKDGDIVCFVTKIEGLDVTHVGFVYWKNDTLRLIHASSGAKKVVIDPKPLQQYAEGIKSTTGVMIVRPQMAF